MKCCTWIFIEHHFRRDYFETQCGRLYTLENYRGKDFEDYNYRPGCGKKRKVTNK